MDPTPHCTELTKSRKISILFLLFAANRIPKTRRLHLSLQPLDFLPGFLSSILIHFTSPRILIPKFLMIKFTSAIVSFLLILPLLPLKRIMLSLTIKLPRSVNLLGFGVLLPESLQIDDLSISIFLLLD